MVDDQIHEQYRITDGRIVTVGKRHRRADPLRADYVLEYRPDVPVAVVEAKRQYSMPGKGLQQAKSYAQLLDVPFAYATNGRGIVEDDADTGREDDRLVGFPGPDELWARYRAWKGIRDDAVADGLVLPFNRALRNADGTVKEPRYYQRTAINRSVEAIMRGDKRLLLTMATGTGKTFVAMQIVWKLWNSTWRTGRKPRILYLADRNILVDQPRLDYFVPAFGEGPIWKLRGDAKAGREIYFALYQALADGGDASGLFRSFDADFFDLVIVDECHRGSAREASSWRAILEHFSPATQLGMTATPKRDETVDTYEYFGDPLYRVLAGPGHRRRLPRAVPRPPCRAQPGRARLGAGAGRAGPVRPRDSRRPVHDEGVRAGGLAAHADRGRSTASHRLPQAHGPLGEDDRLLRRSGARRPDATCVCTTPTPTSPGSIRTTSSASSATRARSGAGI